MALLGVLEMLGKQAAGDVQRAAEGAAVARHAAEIQVYVRPGAMLGPLLRAGRGQFTAALEVVEAERLVMSFLHHMALQRQCRNPFEKGDIAGITNYLDVGLQVLPESGQPARSLPCLDGVLD